MSISTRSAVTEGRASDTRPDTVQAQINYVGSMSVRAKFHAQDHGRDNLVFNPQQMTIQDARRLPQSPTLSREGFALVRHKSKVAEFHDRDEVRDVYMPELARLIEDVTGASKVILLGEGGLIRYAERSPLFGTGMNTQPARFPHIDFTPATAPGLVDNVFGTRAVELKPGQRLVGYNIWRALSGAPQDVPLALCDARTVKRKDVLEADGVYDEGDPSKWWELEAYVVHHNPTHRWYYFRDMEPDEALIFRAYDNSPAWRSGVPHTAFNDTSCPPDGPPRVSIEARAFAIFDK